MTAIDVVQQYFDAMKAGPAEAETLLRLFADDAVYVEPFSGVAEGKAHTHVGRDDIEACFRSSWERTPPDLALEVNRIDVDGDVVRSEWTCTSPAFEAPVRGKDVCTVVGGRIQRLEVTLT